MSNTDQIDYDEDGVKGILSTDVFGDIKVTKGDYSDEWLTLDCIDNLFRSIEEKKEAYSEQINAIYNCLNEYDSISNQKVPLDLTGRIAGLRNVLRGFFPSPSREYSDSRGNKIAEYRDANGKLITMVKTLYNSDGSIYKKIYTDYDSDGNEIRTRYKDANGDVYYDSNETPLEGASQREYEEDQNGPETIDYNGDKLYVTRDSDVEGNECIDYTNMGSDGNYNYMLRVAYNDDGTIAYVNYSERNGKSRVLDVSEYDEYGFIQNRTINDIQQNQISASHEQASPEPLQTQEVSETPTQTATVATNHTGLNVRSGKGTDTEIKTSAAKGSTVTILEDDGSGWVKVRLVDGTEGYVSSDYITRNSGSTTPQNVNTVSSSTSVPSSSQSTQTASLEPSITSGKTAVINTYTGKNLNLRETANGNIVTSIPQGSSIEVLSNDENGWTKIKYGDYVGWVSTERIRIEGE